MEKLSRTLAHHGRSVMAAGSPDLSTGVRPSTRSFTVRLVLLELLDETLLPFLILLSVSILISSVIPTYYVSFYPQVKFQQLTRSQCILKLSPGKFDFCIGGRKWTGWPL